MSNNNPPNIPYASKWTLVEDVTETEYRNNISWSNAGLFKNPKRRDVRSKTYEATFVDEGDETETTAGSNYIAVPAYVNYILETDNFPNPETLSPVGVDKNKWHIDSKEYTKELSMPETRRIRVTWVMQGDWADYNDGSNS